MIGAGCPGTTFTGQTGSFSRVSSAARRAEREGCGRRRPLLSNPGSGASAAAAAVALLICLNSCGYSPQSDSDSAASAGSAQSAAELQHIMGPAPQGTVLEGSGRLAASGAVGVGDHALDSGDYLVTSACVGAPQAVLNLFQQGTGSGSNQSTTFSCGDKHITKVHLMAGLVSARIMLADGNSASTEARAAVRITKNSLD